MRRWRAITILAIGMTLLFGLIATAAGPLKPVKALEGEITVTGKLMRVMAIGGETTGWAVELDEPREIGGSKASRIEIDPAGRPVAEFDHRRVEIAGILEKRSGVERGEYWVIVLKKIRGYAK
jgi:hypothetical protein